MFCSWKYGSCVPSLLERCDFLARQKTLKHLEVVTDADCPAESSIYRMINLDAFRSLTSLSWTAPKESFLPDIYVAIAANERHLQVLELNFHPHSEMDALGEDTRLEPKRENFASWLNKLAALPQAAHSKPLPSLHTLKLCNRYLSGDTAEYMADMDLQSLTLQDCPGWKGFLYAVLARNPAPFPRLAKLQIQETGGSADTVFDDSLVLFLLSTGPLDTMLFKLFSREDVNAAAWETVLHHKATLRNFVLHRRFMLPRSPYEHFFSRDDTRDTHWWIPPPFAPERNPLGECPLLEFFGASHTPKTMVSLPRLLLFAISANLPQLELLDTSPKCEALKVVHIRHSARDRKLGRSTALDSAPADRPDADEGGPVKRRKRSACGCKWYPLTEELRSFADWAFGPAGLPSLQFIVYGDFAKYVRFKSENVVLRRTSQTGAAEYETLQCLHTIMSCRQLSEYRDLLECCPSEDVM